MTGPFRRGRESPRPRAHGRTGAAGPVAGLRSLLSLRSAAGQMFVLQILLVVFVVTASVVALAVRSQSWATDEARRQSVAVARAFANAPGTAGALESDDPTARLQPRTEVARKGSDVDFLVVMSPRGIRYTHPDPNLIGKRFVGTVGPVREGHTVVEEDKGPPLNDGKDTPDSTAVQAVVPVTRPDGSVVGMVAAGVRLDSVSTTVGERLPIMIGSGLAALLLATAGTGLVARRLRRQTHGLGPQEMTRMYEHHDAVLHAVREGVLILGPGGRLLLVNDEAGRLLGLSPGRAEASTVEELGLGEELTGLLTSSEPVTDEVLPAGDRLLAVNKRPTAPYGGGAGSVVTLRDTTELAAVSGKAEVARERLTLLYESGMRVGTTLDVRRTAGELTELAVPRFADVATVDLLEEVVRGQEPRGQTGWRMVRLAISGGDGEDLPLYPEHELLDYMAATPEAEALHSGRAVLSADLRTSEGWRTRSPERAARVLEYGLHSLVTVPLQARGVVLGMVHFWRAAGSPAFSQEDVSFAEELTARAAVSVDNGRRFTREHEMAVTLQRSLLPRGVPQQDALHVAWRYLPAEAGVGGDWFDVLPLPGARVALVVGDVVGHGLHAAATMGRLRTAVQNFSALDLPVDELLGHLDELVSRIDSEDYSVEDTSAEEREAVTGARCLYAIYDQVSGVCTLARAGHPGPTVVLPDGRIRRPDVPASPPLGLGGRPFETTDLHLPEGSQLVLYTDGLIAGRDRDLDSGLDRLQGALERTVGSSPEETCRAVIEATLPEHPSDDVVLLIARTRLLDPSKVAEWEVPPDPAAVGRVRAECGARLEEWGLEEIGYTTELILSELITNAVRYGRPPIRVRLLHDQSLVCEVSDANSTSPHLRQAAITDEGGRGLFLVAQLAERWGTRYTPGGKVIWTEQPLHGAMESAGEASVDDLLDQYDDSAW